MPTSTSNRRPAEIVKCPHCNWKGSARGLHSHCRLLHGKNIKDAREIKVNPYSINKGKKTKKSIGNVNSPEITGEGLLLGLGIALLLRWIKNEVDNNTFQRECYKLKESNNIRTASQNNKSPQRPTTTPPLK
mgnify:FL=1